MQQHEDVVYHLVVVVHVSPVGIQRAIRIKRYQFQPMYRSMHLQKAQYCKPPTRDASPARNRSLDASPYV